MNGVILVTGAHGVGKTKLLRSVSALMEIPCYTAGDLIRLGQEGTPYGDTKIVGKVATNQETLILAIQRILSYAPVFMLDGHTALITSAETVEALDVSYFQSMNLIGVVLLDSNIPNVTRNIQSRDGLSATLPLVSENLRLERQHSITVADALGVPYSRIILQYNDSDVSNLTESIQTVIERAGR